ncbi:MAG: DMT family transporter [Pseudomonadota bacterium]|nr:DMT family transporter [Pseudomonadota bacterium]
MPLPAAFIGVVLIWSTTPLAIKWSSMGAGFLFGVTSRMVIGLLLCVLILMLTGRRLRHDRVALQTYAAAGLGVWVTMMCVYWAALYIPSGLISVVFGITPVFTGLFAVILLGEHVFTRFKIVGMIMGLAGLLLIFRYSLDVGLAAGLGVIAVFIGVLAQSASAVMVKRLRAGIAGIETTTGALLVSTPLFVLSWWLFDGIWPQQLEPRAIFSILYLALFGSVIGFIGYYYLINQWPANRVALIPLVTPVMALLIGYLFNAEKVGVTEMAGVALILAGLWAYEFAGRSAAGKEAVK